MSKTEEMLHSELRSGNTQPGAKAIAYFRRMKRKIPQEVQEVYLRSDSAFYNKRVVYYCEGKGLDFLHHGGSDGAPPAVDGKRFRGGLERGPFASWFVVWGGQVSAGRLMQALSLSAALGEEGGQRGPGGSFWGPGL